MSRSHRTATAIGALVLAAVLTGCGARKTDFANNEGATAWLAHHNGVVPRECINLMIERYGTSNEINNNTQRQAQNDAMRIAGETYAYALASERLIIAREEQVEIAKEGYSKGHLVKNGVAEAIRDLNRAIFERRIERLKLAGLDACNFTATDESFGFTDRDQIDYRQYSD